MTEQKKLTFEDITGKINEKARDVLAYKAPAVIRFPLSEMPARAEDLFGREGVCKSQTKGVIQTYTIHKPRISRPEQQGRIQKEVVVILQPANITFFK